MMLIDDIKKEITENPYVTDEELMDKFGINQTLVVLAVAFMEAEDRQISEKDLAKAFPEFAPVKQRWNFKNWIRNALRSIWKLG